MPWALPRQACFNTQPPEGGWGASSAARIGATVVSTHSRLKAAGKLFEFVRVMERVSTHSRLKAAGEVGQRRIKP